jgi:hypothetical protein
MIVSIVARKFARIDERNEKPTSLSTPLPYEDRSE